jgi:hypothetical protein
MSFTTQTDIRAYFDSVLSGLNLPNYTLDGVQFKPDGKSAFVRAKLAPQETSNMALGAQRKSMPGLLAIDIYVPRSDGVSEAMGYAESVITAFPTQSNPLSNINNTNNGSMTIWSAWIDQTAEEDPYLRVRVFVRYEAFSIPV